MSNKKTFKRFSFIKKHLPQKQNTLKLFSIVIFCLALFGAGSMASAPLPPPPICYGVICNTPGLCQAGIGKCVATSLTDYVCSYNDDPDPCDLDNNICTLDVCKSSDGNFSSSCIATNLDACEGIVPCGRMIDNPKTNWNETAPCEFCHLVLILNRVMNFLMELAAAVSLLAIIITGLLFITSAGNPEIKNKAKTSLKWIIIGLIIVFLAWLLIDFLFSAWGYLDPLGGKWNVIC